MLRVFQAMIVGFIAVLAWGDNVSAQASVPMPQLHLVAQSRVADAVVARCSIGKPSYCFKYGGTLCEKGNSKKNAKGACNAWGQGCLACHNEVPDCLGGTRTNILKAKCERCSTQWQACMAKNDRRHWPNRMRGN
ncbi:MAG: hypothetical protein HOO99_10320 [Hyphomicrobiaceae bacterium]|nr:hypothetical protein [Hyphomicrobiaceae bacterium]